MFLNGIFLLHSTCTNWRMGEDYSGNVVIAHFEICSSIENTLCNDTSCSDGDWCESHLIGNITNSIDSIYCCVLEFIDNNSVFLDLNVCITKLEWFNIGWSSKSNKALLTLY